MRSKAYELGQGKITVHSKHKKEVIGVSEEQHGIRAAPNSHIYVGNLEKNTEELGLRSHLSKICITPLSDVIKLNCRSPKYSSVCVIVDNKDSEDILYNSTNWPLGVQILHRETEKDTN